MKFILTQILCLVIGLICVWADTEAWSSVNKSLTGSIGSSRFYLSKDLIEKSKKIEALLPLQVRPFLAKNFREGRGLEVLLHIYENGEPISEIKNFSFDQYKLILEKLKDIDPKAKIIENKGRELVEFSTKKKLCIAYLEKSLFVGNQKALFKWLAQANLYDNKKLSWAWDLKLNNSLPNLEFRANGVLSSKIPNDVSKITKVYGKVFGLEELNEIKVVYDLQIDVKGNINIHIQTPWQRNDSVMQSLIAPKLLNRLEALPLRNKELVRFDIPEFPLQSWLEWVRTLEYRYKKEYGEEFESDLEDLNQDFGRNTETWFGSQFKNGLCVSVLQDEKSKIVKTQVNLREKLDEKGLLKFLKLLDFDKKDVILQSTKLWEMKDKRDRVFYASPSNQSSLLFFSSNFGKESNKRDIQTLNDSLEIVQKKRILRGNMMLLSKHFMGMLLEEILKKEIKEGYALFAKTGLKPWEMVLNDAHLNHFYEPGNNQVVIKSSMNVKNLEMIFNTFLGLVSKR